MGVLQIIKTKLDKNANGGDIPVEEDNTVDQ